MGPPKHRRVVPRVFTDQQLASIAEAPARVHPRTLLGICAEPLAQLALRFVPEDIAPNLLSLCALLCCVHAYYITAVYGDAYPRMVFLMAGAQLGAFHLISMCVGRHAAQLKPWSPLDDIFHTITSSIAVTFVVYVFAYQVGLQAPLDQWYCVQLAYGAVLWERLSMLVAGKKSMLGWFRIWQGVEEPIAV